MSDRSEADHEPTSRFRGRRLAKRVALVAIGAFVVGFAVSALWMRAGSPGRTVTTVPGLGNLPLAEARRAVEDADLVLETADSLPHPEVEAGRVLTQSPLPGQEVAPGTAVQVILSSGRQRHAVPQVEGLSREQAEQVLLATGLRPTVEEVNDRRRAGLVVGTDPSAGTVVAVPAPVRLRVSAGPPLVPVPDLLGMNEQEVPGALQVADLRLGEVGRELRLLGMEGEVIAQQPAAGDSIPAGSSIDVTVATQQIEIVDPGDFR